MFEKAAVFSGLLVLITFFSVGFLYYQTLEPEDRIIPVLDRSS